MLPRCSRRRHAPRANRSGTSHVHNDDSTVGERAAAQQPIGCGRPPAVREADPEPEAPVSCPVCPSIERVSAAVTSDETSPAPPAAPAHPVLVGYDGSRASRRALAWATGLARRTSRPLLVAHISPDPSRYDMGTDAPFVFVADPEDDVLDRLRAELADALTAATLAGVEVHVADCVGDTARQLARLADEHWAEALVLGAPEHRLHHLIGSVPAWMARRAHCPVVVVP
nr:universal stress protein [Streptomyces sp. SID13666]